MDKTQGNDKPVVSVVIPTKDRVDLLAETLDSLRAQTCEAWEAIVVDDGSSDGTLPYLRETAEQEPRIRFFERTGSRSGACVARNQGFERVRADSVVFLDSDDLLAADALRGRVEFLSERPELDFGVFPCEIFRATAGDLGELLGAEPRAEADLHRFLLHEIPWITCSVIWRKAAIERLGGWNEELSCWQDWDLHARACARGLRHVKIDGQSDCFLRRANHGTIGGRARGLRDSASRCLAVESVAEEIVKNGDLDAATKKLLRNLAFYVSTGVAAKGGLDVGLACWKACRRLGVVGGASFRLGLLGLHGVRLKRIPLLRGLRWRHLFRILHGPDGGIKTYHRESDGRQK